MRQLSGKFYVALVVCFLSICFVSAAFAEKMTDSGKIPPEKRLSSHSLSKFLARSNFVEKLPDITNKQLRDNILRQTAREFLGDQSESLESDPYFFNATDTEGPWFQGWYTRITSRDCISIAVIGATQYLPQTDFPIPYDMYLPGYLAVIVSDQGRTKIYEVFPEKTVFLSNRNLGLDDPTSSSWEEFSWYSENGIITNQHIRISIPGEIEVSATLGPRLPFNTNIPNIQWLGTEGLVEFWPIVPLHQTG